MTGYVGGMRLCACRSHADPCAEHFNADLIADVSRRCAPPITPRAFSSIPHPFLPIAPHILYSVGDMALRAARARAWVVCGNTVAYAHPPRGDVYCHGTRVRPIVHVRTCGPSLRGGCSGALTA